MNSVRSDREGFALVLVLIVMIVIGSVSTAAAIMGANAFVIAQQQDRRGVLEAVANAGLEQARARINGDRTLYPDSGYAVLESGVTVVDANGVTVPGVRRWTYTGPSGITTGQYGVFGSIISIAESPNGDRVIRRGEVMQESFAKYAYFTDVENPASIRFGGGDQIFGPVHSNDDIGIWSSGATFHSLVTTASTFIDPQYGDFRQGRTAGVRNIPMPTTADLNKLRTYAQTGGTAIVSNTTGGPAHTTTRIEFVAVDLDGSGSPDGPDEGFMRVFQSANWDYVSAHAPTGGIRNSYNCGHYHGATFVHAAVHPNNGADDWKDALGSASRRCFLGGAEEIHNGVFVVADPYGPGAWQPWSGTVDPRLAAAGRTDADYLWPINRSLNPNFKGVIFVDGKVSISGRLRGRVTLAATDNIVIADDVRYVTDPATQTCNDMLGIFGGQDILIADNALNTPQSIAGYGYRGFDDTKDETIHGVVLALNEFAVQNYGNPPDDEEDCETIDWGRGCLYLTGGVIQRRRGPVGQTNGHGYLKRYSYDGCAATDPPPYFPTTGWFARGRLFEVDPTGFNVDTLFARIAPLPY